MKKKNVHVYHEISSGNVFADLGLPNPEELLAKAELAIQINNLIKEKNLTQVQAAKLLEVDQPKISALKVGKLSGFSLERLFKFLTILGQDITIKVSKPKIKRKAQVTVSLPKLHKTSFIRKKHESPQAIHARKKK